LLIDHQTLTAELLSHKKLLRDILHDVDEDVAERIKAALEVGFPTSFYIFKTLLF
jgi:hypothetical protein